MWPCFVLPNNKQALHSWWRDQNFLRVYIQIWGKSALVMIGSGTSKLHLYACASEFVNFVPDAELRCSCRLETGSWDLRVIFHCRRADPSIHKIGIFFSGFCLFRILRVMVDNTRPKRAWKLSNSVCIFEDTIRLLSLTTQSVKKSSFFTSVRYDRAQRGS